MMQSMVREKVRCQKWMLLISNDSGRERKCAGIIVRKDDSYIEDAGLKFEGVSIDEFGVDTIVYFPEIA